MPWSWRRIAASWSASWLAASAAAALTGAPEPVLPRVCDTGADAATYYPIVFTGVVESVAQQRDATRRAGLPSWVPAWVPFTSVEGPVAQTVVRFQVSARYRGDVHSHESVHWLAGGRPHAGSRYTVFATVDRDHLATDPCAPTTQVRFDAARYGLVAQPPMPDPDPFAGWQAGAAAVATALVLSAAAALLLRRRRRQPG
ncbi:MAG: hypothetical protein DLM67_10150 [Candidatus Nephthysia bennettiae]|nr:hypothetical protein [Candidatus Dormibacteraeota bacterium]PZR96010.1 MAG: hypothetical protein DLM67_10150 [Candidatus Dormibacteraeota bacterium]